MGCSCSKSTLSVKSTIAHVKPKEVAYVKVIDLYKNEKLYFIKENSKELIEFNIKTETGIRRTLNIKSALPSFFRIINLGESLYICGGGDKSTEFQKHTLQLNPDTLSFTKRGNMSEGKANMGITGLNTKHFYIAGGNNHSLLSTCEEYSSSSHTWTRMPNLNEPKSSNSLCLFQIKKQICRNTPNLQHVLSPSHSHSPSSHFAPHCSPSHSDSLSLTCPVSPTTSGNAAGAANNQAIVYSIGGYTYDEGRSECCALIEKMNLNRLRRRWEVVPVYLGHGVCAIDAGAVQVKESIYVFGGFSLQGLNALPVNHVWAFDTNHNALWNVTQKLKPDLPFLQCNQIDLFPNMPMLRISSGVILAVGCSLNVYLFDFMNKKSKVIPNSQFHLEINP